MVIGHTTWAMEHTELAMGHTALVIRHIRQVSPYWEVLEAVVAVRLPHNFHLFSFHNDYAGQ